MYPILQIDKAEVLCRLAWIGKIEFSAGAVPTRADGGALV